MYWPKDVSAASLAATSVEYSTAWVDSSIDNLNSNEASPAILDDSSADNAPTLAAFSVEISDSNWDSN